MCCGTQITDVSELGAHSVSNSYTGNRYIDVRWVGLDITWAGVTDDGVIQSVLCNKK